MDYQFLLDCQIIKANESSLLISSLLMSLSTCFNFFWLIYWRKNYLSYQAKDYSAHLNVDGDSQDHMLESKVKPASQRYTVAKRDDNAVQLNVPVENQELLKGLFNAEEQAKTSATKKQKKPKQEQRTTASTTGDEEESSSSSLELGPHKPDVENMTFHTRESDGTSKEKDNGSQLKFVGKPPPLVNFVDVPRAKDNTNT
ncbi:hypothetical protein RFI_01503 [Reticulomyxa filosa]|uniref:Uncharacterized protein n=1 Tax=Reticulomyxa filosa TaxID=46433 RepID=X6PBJ6_RETFI|nr:hypothetical protein RFI_01503 [Reticulomyxa filosa]|eukprot:ETO35561.1 hypothetical protein RFI_01503 [Reticulomyxa filosa]